MSHLENEPDINPLTPLGNEHTAADILDDEVVHQENNRPISTGRPLPRERFQIVFTEARERGLAKTAEAAVIILGGIKRALPFAADRTEVSPPIRDTRLLANTPRSRRRFLAIAASVAAGVAGGGITWAMMASESAQDRAEEEKLQKERTVITEVGYKTVDLLQQENVSSDISEILRQLIAYDPRGIVSRIEQLQPTSDYYSAAWLGAHLAPRNQAGAQRIMQGFVSQEKYEEAAIIALQLASFAQSPTGVDSPWQDEVQKLRTTIANSSSPSEGKRQDLDRILAVAADLKSADAAMAMREFGNVGTYWAASTLSLALAQHNPNAVNDEMLRWIRQANTVKDDTSNGSRGFIYSTMQTFCQGLLPHAPEMAAEGLKHIDQTGVYSDEATTIAQNIAAELIAYRPEAAMDYLKNGSEDPTQWQTHRWNQLTAISLGHAAPAMTTALRQRSTSPFAEWMEASIDPLNAALIESAYKAVDQGSYAKQYTADLASALLLSRQPKA